MTKTQCLAHAAHLEEAANIADLNNHRGAARVFRLRASNLRLMAHGDRRP